MTLNKYKIDPLIYSNYLLSHSALQQNRDSKQMTGFLYIQSGDNSFSLQVNPSLAITSVAIEQTRENQAGRSASNILGS